MESENIIIPNDDTVEPVGPEFLYKGIGGPKKYFNKKKVRNPKYIKPGKMLDLPMAEQVELAETIKIARTLTQKQLAHELGANQPVVSSLENGHANPTQKMLARIAKTTGRKLVIDFRLANL